MDDIATALFCACTVLCFSPGAMAGKTSAKIAAAAMAAGFVATPLLHCGRSDILIPAGALVIVAYTVAEWAWRNREVRDIFAKDLAWTYVEDASRFCFRMAVVLSGLMALLWQIPGSVLLAACYSAMYYSSYSGRTVIMKTANERKIKAMIKSYPKMIPQIPDDNEKSMARLFQKIEQFMKDRKPFLRNDFTISELSTEVFSNKTYVSRTINYFSGRNFKQYVNWYRVEYAMELIKKDPRLSVAELASMSGFHSSVTMNMAFKLYYNDSPGSVKRSSEEIAHALKVAGEDRGRKKDAGLKT